MSAPARLALFAALLAVVAAVAAWLGGALDPDVRGDDRAGASTETGALDQPRGLAAAADGLRLVPETTELPADRPTPFRFRIVDAGERTVRDFEVEHERRMHLIVVRRDLSGYQHLHPRQAGDGSWEVDLRLPEAGVYRAYADFQREGKPRTLAVDLTVPGRFEPRELPPPAATAPAGDGYEVALDERDGELRFRVEKDGGTVTDVEPYLGARGHLVVLRTGDLAYLHVHPVDEAAAGRDIRFAVEYPSTGRYGLFLQFKHEGRVRTAVFSRDAAPTEGSDDGDEH